jgi:predicted transcriptional regulator
MKRETAINTINELPKEFQLEDLVEKLFFVEKVQKGLAQAKKGKTIAHDKVMEQFRKKWSK